MHDVHNDFPLCRFRDPLDGGHRHRSHHDEEGKEEIIEARPGRLEPYTSMLYMCVEEWVELVERAEYCEVMHACSGLKVVLVFTKVNY